MFASSGEDSVRKQPLQQPPGVPKDTWDQLHGKEPRTLSHPRPRSDVWDIRTQECHSRLIVCGFLFSGRAAWSVAMGTDASLCEVVQVGSWVLLSVLACLASLLSMCTCALNEQQVSA